MSFLFIFSLQVVKAFVVLSHSFKSQDPEKLASELQEHVKKVTAPYKYPRKVSTHEIKNLSSNTVANTAQICAVQGQAGVEGTWNC